MISNILNIGGNRPGAIPVEAFNALLKKFPNSMELNRYANTRIEVLVGDFVNQLGSEREKYEQYLDRRSQSIADAPLQQYELLQSELDKFLYLRGNPLFLMGFACRTTRPFSVSLQV